MLSTDQAQNQPLVELTSGGVNQEVKCGGCVLLGLRAPGLEDDGPTLQPRKMGGGGRNRWPQEAGADPRCPGKNSILLST